MADGKTKSPPEEAAFAVDAQNRAVYWNEGAAALLGFDESQTLDRHLAELLTVWDLTDNRYPVGTNPCMRWRGKTKTFGSSPSRSPE